MGRNYFSKHGGPLFINNGFSGHLEDHSLESNQNLKSDKALILSIAIGAILLLTILYAVVIAL